MFFFGNSCLRWDPAKLSFPWFGLEEGEQKVTKECITLQRLTWRLISIPNIPGAFLLCVRFQPLVNAQALLIPLTDAKYISLTGAGQTTKILTMERRCRSSSTKFRLKSFTNAFVGLNLFKFILDLFQKEGFFFFHRTSSSRSGSSNWFLFL